MDKSNKYFSLIEKLVKNHRKFQGYEAILDEIVDDVYAHAESVINSIDNESVIQTYLQKVVSTSIITVPKRLNFHSELKHRNISTEIEIKSPEVSAEPSNEESFVNDVLPETQPIIEMQQDVVFEENALSEDNTLSEDSLVLENDVASDFAMEVHEDDAIEMMEEPVQKADPELVDRMINSIATETVAEAGISELSEEEVEETFELVDEVDSIELTEDFNEESDSDIEESAIEEVETDDLPTMDTDNFDEIQMSEVIEENTDSINFETIEEPLEISNENDSNDITLDDNAEPENEPAILTMQEDIVEYSPNDTEALEMVQEEDSLTEEFAQDGIGVDLNEEEFAENLESDTENDDGQIDELEAVDTEDLVENEYSDSDNSELEELNEDFEESFVNLENSGDMLEQDANFADDEIISMEPSEDLEGGLVDSDDMLTEMSGDDIGLVFEPTEDDMLQNQDFDNSIGLEESVPELSEDNNSSQQEDFDFKSVDYSAFDYTPEPEENDFDKTYLEEQLLNLDKSKPELNILKIFELKYKQNLSISSIAEQLNTDKQSIIAALDELIKLV